MIYSFGIKHGGATFDAVDDISFFEQVFAEVSAILSGYAGYKGSFCCHLLMD